MSKNFLTDSLLYIFSDVINKSAIFLMIPIYTSVFTVEEYGILETILISIGAASLIIGFSSKITFLRLIYDYKGNEIKRHLFDTMTIITFITSLLFILVLVFEASFVNIFGNNYRTFAFLILSYVFFLCLNELSLVILRYEKKVFQYLLYTFIKTIFEISLIIYFVVTLNQGLLGRLEGSLISMMIVFIIFLKFFVWRNVIPSFNFVFIMKYFKYSFPIVLTQIVGWILISYDKLLLNQSFSIKELGIFALGTQVLMIYKYIAEASFKAFNVEIFENPKIIENNLYNIILVVCSASAILALLITFMSNDIVMLIANISYIEASKVVKYMVFAKFISVYVAFLILVLYLYKDSFSIAKVVFKCMLIMIVVSTILVPLLQFIGAGISAIIVNGIMAYLLTAEVKKYVEVQFDYKMIVVVLILVMGILLSFISPTYLYNFVFLIGATILFFYINKEFILRIILRKA